jgi:hypothetical protein
MNNIIRFNSFRNNNGGYVSFRNGNNNIIYSNFMMNSSGIRIKQASNISAYNNYFYYCDPPFTFVNLTGLYPNLSLYQNNINIQNNTFYNCQSLNFGTRNTSNNTIANNLLYQTLSSINLVSGNISSFTISGNLYSGTIGVTSNGFTSAQLLFNNNTAYYTISGNSPAIGKNVVNIPSLLSISDVVYDSTVSNDITGLSRTGLKDVGCNQYSNIYNTHLNYPLTVNKVGPIYLQN